MAVVFPTPLDMSGEVVQDGLPTSALDLRFVFRLGLKNLPYKHSAGSFGELYPDFPAVFQFVFDQLFGDDSRVPAFKIVV